MIGKLGDICQFLNGGTPSKEVSGYFEGETPWITSADITGPVADAARSFITDDAIKNSATNKVAKGTVLLVTRTGVGKVCIAGRELCFSQDITAIQPDPSKLDSGYLVQFLKTKREYFERLARGATIKGITRDVVTDLEIPLPSLTEQRRIAAILDQADALRAKRRDALTQLDELQMAIFIEMFGVENLSPITASDKFPVHPKGWKWELLTNYARLATGHTPDREKEEYWHGDIPWISLTDIRGLNGRRANQTGQNVTASGIENSSAVVLPKGTVCFSRTASVGFVTIMGSDMATSQDFVNWVPGPNLDPIYLMHALMISKPQLLALSTGSTHRTIYMRVVEHFRALMPPIDLQREFARIIDAIHGSKGVNQKSMAELDALFLSLQHRAFQGAL